MMNLTELSNAARRNAKEHSPLILSVFAGLGTITTAYLAARAGFEAGQIIHESESISGTASDRKEQFKERTKLVWKLYIPASVSAVGTVTCIVFANRMGLRKTLAAQTAFSVSQQLYSEYRDKVIEEFGAKKDESIRGQIAEDRLKLNPPAEVIVAGSGNVLCCEVFTGRYFNCDMETLKRAQNHVNAKALAHDYATMSDFYYEIKLPQTSNSSEIGWRATRLMELEFTTDLAQDGRPCLSFEYNYTAVL